MQKKKDDLREEILKQAKREFLACGYQKASLRRIAAGAKITHTNIYHYYPSKDKLYRAVLNPLLTSIRDGLGELLKMESSAEHNDLQDHLSLLQSLIRYISNERNLLKLLIFQSSGSTLADYRNKMVDELTRFFQVVMEGMSLRHDKLNPEISDFFLHNIASLWVNFATECLMHDIAENEMLKTAEMLMSFMYNGWCGLYDLNCSS